MWRHDPGRGAWSPDALPETLHLQWTRELPAPLPAWPPNQGALRFDSQAEPILLGERLFIPSSRNDSITAINTRSGEELWRFYADGPVRFAPVGTDDRIFFVSDDGHLYCLGAADGRLLWKLKGGPPQRRLILGNDRLVSSWPARGGPVLHDGRLFFGASIWPFMGIFIHAVDPETGALLWTNSGDGTNYMKQPHDAPAFAGLVPQGHLAALASKLLVPGGRSTPGVFDTATGKQLFFNFDKKTGGHRVGIAGDLYFSGEDAYLADGGSLLSGGAAAIFNAEEIIASDPKAILGRSTFIEIEITETIDKRGKTIRTINPKYRELHRTDLEEAPPGTWFLGAGDRLYSGGAGKVAAYEIDGSKPAWTTSVPGEVRTMLAGDDRLFVVTSEDQLLCFGRSKPAKPARLEEESARLSATSSSKDDDWRDRAKAILAHPGAGEGYALALGIGSGRLIDELLDLSDLHVIAIDRDPAKLETFRRRMQAAGLHGERVAAVTADFTKVDLPPYLCNLIVSEEPDALGLANPATASALFETLRPYGGIASFELPEATHASLETQIKGEGFERATLTRTGDWTTLTREGALPGADDWTHQVANAAQSVVSSDTRVKAPFGVLWFGGPSHEGILPRHGHGPSPQVAGGRLFIEGADLLRSVDVYTGRLLWEKKIQGFGEYYDTTAHFPGAGEIGSNYVSLPDRIYAVNGEVTLELDAANGKTLREYPRPAPSKGEKTSAWGSLRVSGDYFIATAAPVALDKSAAPKIVATDDPDEAKPETDPKPGAKDNEDEEKIEMLTALPDAKHGSGSRSLEVYDRRSGKLLWSRQAAFNFRHNNIAVAANRLFCIDRMSDAKEQYFTRRGLVFEGKPVLYALDLATGGILWQRDADVFGTFLSYSSAHDVLLQAGSYYRDRAADEIKTGMMALRGKDGEVLWHDPLIEYGGPCLLWRDKILTNGLGGFALELMTGKKTGWNYTRAYGCNTAVGSENLLTVRSGEAGFFDLANDSGTGNLGGFKSSCTSNLIPAGGVLNAPDYTRTCTCSYQNQTSLALVHMPEAEFWTYGAGADEGRLGINFGAPGDRRSPEGTLFLEYPVVGGASPAIELTIEGEEISYPRIHSSLMADPNDPRAWLGASAIEGASKITLETGKEKGPARVRLYFAELDETIAPGERIFSVKLNGDTVEDSIDLANETAPRTVLVREFKLAPTPAGILEIEFTTHGNREPLLSGVELIWD